MAQRKHYQTGDRVESVCSGRFLGSKGTITGRPQFSYGTPEYMVKLDNDPDREYRFKWNWLRPIDDERD